MPGNCRELRSIAYDALSRCQTEQLSLSLFGAIASGGSTVTSPAQASEPLNGVHAIVDAYLQSHPLAPELWAIAHDLLNQYTAIQAVVGEQQTRDSGGNGTARITEADTLPTIKEATEQLVAEAMRRAGGNQAAAARILGITRQALSQRIRRADT